MRNLTQHQINGVNEELIVKVLDIPGQGGACHEYEISFRDKEYEDCFFFVGFQNGPIKEADVNGVTHEALLAILIDRLEGFQSGQYACEDNAEALFALRTALSVLQRRTRARLARGVEGTNVV